jgi:hypothetical protein
MSKFVFRFWLSIIRNREKFHRVSHWLIGVWIGSVTDYCGICRSYNLVIRRSCLANQIAIPFFHIGPFLLVNWESSWIFTLLTWILLWNDMRFSILNLWRYLNILTKLPICKVWWIYFHGRKTVRHIIVRYFFTF